MHTPSLLYNFFFNSKSKMTSCHITCSWIGPSGQTCHFCLPISLLLCYLLIFIALANSKYNPKFNILHCYNSYSVISISNFNFLCKFNLVTLLSHQIFILILFLPNFNNKAKVIFLTYLQPQFSKIPQFRQNNEIVVTFSPVSVLTPNFTKIHT